MSGRGGGGKGGRKEKRGGERERERRTHTFSCSVWALFKDFPTRCCFSGMVWFGLVVVARHLIVVDLHCSMWLWLCVSWLCALRATTRLSSNSSSCHPKKNVLVVSMVLNI